jgi:hypothetical protein
VTLFTVSPLAGSVMKRVNGIVVPSGKFGSPGGMVMSIGVVPSGSV